jgi:hypothetical protein
MYRMCASIAAMPCRQKHHPPIACGNPHGPRNRTNTLFLSPYPVSLKIKELEIALKKGSNRQKRGSSVEKQQLGRYRLYFSAVQAAQKATCTTRQQPPRFSAVQAAQKTYRSPSTRSWSFSAVQAAQKSTRLPATYSVSFSAVQAAQKWPNDAAVCSLSFSAVQAAQKRSQLQ